MEGDGEVVDDFEVDSEGEVVDDFEAVDSVVEEPVDVGSIKNNMSILFLRRKRVIEEKII